MKLHAGDWVQVRSKEEILGTLDKDGRLDGLPFMPQMLNYCGRQVRVQSSAYKTCDTVSGRYRGRRLPDAVHLNVRCDGEAYGGCQASCLIFWKNAWLKPIDGPTHADHAPDDGGTEIDVPHKHQACTEGDVWRCTIREKAGGGETRYSCQATELLNYTTPLKWWDARQYVEAYTSGNRTLGEIIRGLVYLFYYYATLSFSERWGGLGRWLYNRFQAATGGVRFPRQKGKIPTGQPTPRHDLDLRSGDFVRVKSHDEILATLDIGLSNRGLAFDAELVPFCGKVFRVDTRIDRFVDEKTGRIRTLKTPAVILENVRCRSLYSGQRLFCPRSINCWWREIWLDRVAAGTSAVAPAPITETKLAQQSAAECGGVATTK